MSATMKRMKLSPMVEDAAKQADPNDKALQAVIAWDPIAVTNSLIQDLRRAGKGIEGFNESATMRALVQFFQIKIVGVDYQDPDAYAQAFARGEMRYGDMFDIEGTFNPARGQISVLAKIDSPIPMYDKDHIKEFCSIFVGVMMHELAHVAQMEASPGLFRASAIDFNSGSLSDADMASAYYNNPLEIDAFAAGAALCNLMGCDYYYSTLLENAPLTMDNRKAFQNRVDFWMGFLSDGRKRYVPMDEVYDFSSNKLIEAA